MKTAKSASKFFVVMRPNSKGKLRCCSRLDIFSNELFAWKSRAWANKYAAKVGGDVFSVQGLMIPERYSWDLEQVEIGYRVKVEAERTFGH